MRCQLRQFRYEHTRVLSEHNTKRDAHRAARKILDDFKRESPDVRVDGSIKRDGGCRVWSDERYCFCLAVGPI